MTTRPFYWSVRREVWENRSVVIVPGCAALLFLVAFLTQLPQFSGAVSTEGSLQDWCDLVSRVLSFLALLTGILYSLDALYGERRDRSILFWKSLPVSDRVTVLSKAFVPLIVIPAATFIAVLAVQVCMALSGTAAVLVAGGNPTALWVHLPWIRMTGELLGGLAVMAIWQAPVYGWLLLISAWARRSVLLWAMLLPLAVCLFERFAFGTGYLGSVLLHRLTAGVLGESLLGGLPGSSVLDRLTALSPWHLATDPDLWLGLIPTLLLLAGAIASRRYRQPI